MAEERISLKNKRIHILFLLAVIAGLGIWGFLRYLPSQPAEEPAAVSKPEPAPPPEEIKVIAGKIAKGKSLSTTLRAEGVSADMIESIRKQLHPILNLRRMNPGDAYELRLNSEGKFRGFSYRASPIDVYQIEVQPSGEWKTEKLEIAVDKYWARISGEIDSSFFEAMDRLGRAIR